MQYYNPEDKRPLRWALLAVVLYVVILATLMLLMRFSVAQTHPADEGILVDFGQTEMGEGEEELLATDVAATPPPPQSEESEEQLESDERNEVEIPEQENEPNKEPSPATEESTQQRDTVVVEQRTVNQQALFPGRKAESESSSQGTTEGAGNQGDESGAEGGATEGGGDGNQAVAVVKNRSVVGSLPTPAYRANASGKVIIDITVDDTGRVKSATYRAQGSTTNNSQLVAAAQEAALKARFTPNDNLTDDAIQGGTITYIFKMN